MFPTPSWPLKSTLKFPGVLEIRTVDSVTRRPAPQIGLLLTIFAPSKNNYNLVRITGGEGTASVTSAEMQESIRTDQKLFPMDYASCLAECAAVIAVEICSAQQVRKAVKVGLP